MTGKKQNIDQMWIVLDKEVDLGEPTSFFDNVYLGCTQRQCEESQNIVDNYRTMFESRISAGGTEKLPFSQNNRISSWSYDLAGHAKKCVERYFELANKTTQQLYKVSTPCIDDHHFKEEEEVSRQLEQKHGYVKAHTTALLTSNMYRDLPRLLTTSRCFSRARSSVSCRTLVPIAVRFSCSWRRATPRMISNCQRLSRSVNTLKRTRGPGLLENGQMASGEERLEGKWLVH